MSGRSIFAIEICTELDGQAQAFLKRLLTENTQILAPGQKWALYDQAARCLVSLRGKWRSGCWDFFDDDTRARGDFNMWVQGLMTEEGSRPHPSGSPDPYRGEPRFMTFTMACLMVTGSQCERQISAACAIPPSDLWRSDTFARMLANLRFVNFVNVEGSTMYLIPGDMSYGLTSQDLEHPKFEYLRPIG